MKTSDWIGFVGVFILLIAFFLNLVNVLHKNSSAYMLMNIIGAGIACYASVLIHYIPFIVLEGIWTVVSVAVFIQTLLKNKS